MHSSRSSSQRSPFRAGCGCVLAGSYRTCNDTDRKHDQTCSPATKQTFRSIVLVIARFWNLHVVCLKLHFLGILRPDRIHLSLLNSLLTSSFVPLPCLPSPLFLSLSISTLLSISLSLYLASPSSSSPSSRSIHFIVCVITYTFRLFFSFLNESVLFGRFSPLW